MFAKSTLRCSFCRKTDTQVAKLVAGPRVYICDACVAIASRLMDGASPDRGPVRPARTSVWRELLSRARRFLLFRMSEPSGSA
jgi:ClpX C4-type zinc finger